ncbi:hypothetical protein [Novipirellula maiorica]|uniref:hypothetical protein n=1 Tax=Novipirellula maiorica TaxID=1265734 RepID=UPI00118185A0|nr:hypothetical protein [Rhodopirellula maiorica]
MNATVDSGKTISVLRFGSPGNLVVERDNGVHTLRDGNYQLNILAWRVATVGGGPNMAENYSFGDEEVDGFFRFFGDGDGDRDTDVADLGQFGAAFRSRSGDDHFNSDFDVDGDDDVDVADLGQFGQRFRERMDF